MAYLSTPVSQHFASDELPAAVRAALGKSLRRVAAINQLAVIGARAAVPESRRQSPSALLWQSTGGPRHETQSLLREVCAGSGEAMPYDFLAIQPALAGAQIQGFLPGLQSASYFPLDNEMTAQWALLLNLALNLLDEGRHAHVLCAYLELLMMPEDSSMSHSGTGQSPVGCSAPALDSRLRGNDGDVPRHPAGAIRPGFAVGHWLSLSPQPLENSTLRLQRAGQPASENLPDTPDFPRQLEHWLEQRNSATLNLQSPAGYRQALEFTRL